MLNNEGLFSLENDPTLRTAKFLAFLLSLKGVGSAKALKLALSASDIDEVTRGLGTNTLPEMFKSWVLPNSKLHSNERLIGYFDDAYPKMFRSLATPPAVVWLYGELPNELEGVGVVGTRNMSRDGRECTRAISISLSSSAHFLVSGLADGVDSLAHEVSLGEGVTNVAVIGEGIDGVSGIGRPELLKKILNAGGAVISEKPAHSQSSPGGFVERNRLIAALSEKLVVPECGIPSGTLHTVSATLKLEKPVLVAEYSVASPANLGNRFLTGRDHNDLSTTQKDWLHKMRLFDVPTGLIRTFSTNEQFKSAMRK
jgi:DNA processing protein